MIAWIPVLEIQEELARLLGQTREDAGMVLKRLKAGDVDPIELVGLLESLGLLDQQRAHLLERARLEASATRRRDEERSIRQFVLHALDEIGVPQTAGFLEDYVYAHERVVLNTRSFGALRRDENRAWRRRPGHRRAYIVPCLDGSGRPVPRWMARSDWPLSARLVMPHAEALWSWTRVLVLTNRLRDEDDETTVAIYAPLIDKYAREARGGDVSWSGTPSDVWLRDVEGEAAHEVKRLSKDLERARSDVEARFARFDPEEQLWGVTSTPSRRSTAVEPGGGPRAE